jgi:hypothetical protein
MLETVNNPIKLQIITYERIQCISESEGIFLIVAVFIYSKYNFLNNKT